MTDGDALLRAILANPDEDTPRLVYADWLEEHDRGERAEFIRLQCELFNHAPQVGWLEQMPVEQWAGDATEGDLLRRLDPLVKRHTELCRLYVRDCAEWSREFIKGVLGKNWLQLSASWEWGWERGFVTTLTCTAADWLAHADSLAWHPSASGECPRCYGNRTRWHADHDNGGGAYLACHRCNGTGRLPRPTPPTAQPITRVTLTTEPVWESQQVREAFDGMVHTDRTGETFTCHRWPGITFVLPDFGTSDLRSENMRVERSGYSRHLQRMFKPQGGR